jgi:hypothetical protein
MRCLWKSPCGLRKRPAVAKRGKKLKAVPRKQGSLHLECWPHEKASLDARLRQTRQVYGRIVLLVGMPDGEHGPIGSYET